MPSPQDTCPHCNRLVGLDVDRDGIPWDHQICPVCKMSWMQLPSHPSGSDNPTWPTPPTYDEVLDDVVANLLGDLLSEADDTWSLEIQGLAEASATVTEDEDGWVLECERQVIVLLLRAAETLALRHIA